MSVCLCVCVCMHARAHAREREREREREAASWAAVASFPGLVLWSFEPPTIPSKLPGPARRLRQSEQLPWSMRSGGPSLAPNPVQSLDNLQQGCQTHQGPHQPCSCPQRTEIILELYKCNYSLTVKDLKLHLDL